MQWFLLTFDPPCPLVFPLPLLFYHSKSFSLFCNLNRLAHPFDPASQTPVSVPAFGFLNELKLTPNFSEFEVSIHICTVGIIIMGIGSRHTFYIKVLFLRLENCNKTTVMSKFVIKWKCSHTVSTFFVTIDNIEDHLMLIYCNLLNSCQSAIRRVNISGNVDNPEGTLDALMQIAVCGSVRMLYLKPFKRILLSSKKI